MCYIIYYETKYAKNEEDFLPTLILEIWETLFVLSGFVSVMKYWKCLDYILWHLQSVVAMSMARCHLKCERTNDFDYGEIAVNRIPSTSCEVLYGRSWSLAGTSEHSCMLKHICQWKVWQLCDLHITCTSGKCGDSDKGIYSFKIFKISIITIIITYHQTRLEKGR